MDAAIRRLRAERQRLGQGKPPSQVRYPDGFRRAAVDLMRRQGAGASVARLARALGISEPTLTKWRRPEPAAALRPVALVAPAAPPAAPAGGAVLLTPQGLRVEGLDRDTLIAVLQALR